MTDVNCLSYEAHVKISVSLAGSSTLLSEAGLLPLTKHANLLNISIPGRGAIVKHDPIRATPTGWIPPARPRRHSS